MRSELPDTLWPRQRAETVLGFDAMKDWTHRRSCDLCVFLCAVCVFATLVWRTGYRQRWISRATRRGGPAAGVGCRLTGQLSYTSNWPVIMAGHPGAGGGICGTGRTEDCRRFWATAGQDRRDGCTAWRIAWGRLWPRQRLWLIPIWRKSDYFWRRHDRRFGRGHVSPGGGAAQLYICVSVVRTGCEVRGAVIVCRSI